VAKPNMKTIKELKYSSATYLSLPAASSTYISLSLPATTPLVSFSNQWLSTSPPIFNARDMKTELICLDLRLNRQ